MLEPIFCVNLLCSVAFDLKKSYNWLRERFVVDFLFIRFNEGYSFRISFYSFIFHKIISKCAFLASWESLIVENCHCCRHWAGIGWKQTLEFFFQLNNIFSISCIWMPLEVFCEVLSSDYLKFSSVWVYQAAVCFCTSLLINNKRMNGEISKSQKNN